MCVIRVCARASDVLRSLTVCWSVRYIKLLVRNPFIRSSYLLSDIDGSTVGSCTSCCSQKAVCVTLTPMRPHTHERRRGDDAGASQISRLRTSFVSS